LKPFGAVKVVVMPALAGAAKAQVTAAAANRRARIVRDMIFSWDVLDNAYIECNYHARRKFMLLINILYDAQQILHLGM
jgi:hypothetical protein